jgi:hypothetical protein
VFKRGVIRNGFRNGRVFIWVWVWVWVWVYLGLGLFTLPFNAVNKIK